MDLKNKTRTELEDKVEKLERLIAKRGIGSKKLARAERIQRDMNLAIILGGVTILLGITAWSIYKYRGD